MFIKLFKYSDYYHRFTQCLDLLSSCELSHREKFIDIFQERQFTLRHIFLQLMLKKYLQSKEQIIIVKSNTNSWLAINYPELYISLSESNDYFVVCISNSGIGIDIEYITPFSEMDEIVSSFFHKNEIKKYNKLPIYSKVLFFYKLWTAKEAYIKLAGIKEPNTYEVPINNLMKIKYENTEYNWKIIDGFYICCWAKNIY